MRLKSFSTYGFKSFADKTELTFDKGITAVVGPNGSGKSNISDAIRWVLGEQSAKYLRGGKMEDVIFSGTSKRRPLGVAEVTLNFDNSDHTLPLDFDEISLTRRIYRSGESDYAINKKNCRLKDIIDLMADTGLGKGSMSIIGQNKIDEILNSRPEDRRALFEEAAGIAKYRLRKKEAERRLDDTALNLTRINDIKTEVEKQVTPLQAAAEKTKQYNELNEKLRRCRLGVIVRKLDEMEQVGRKLRDKKVAAEQEYAASAAELSNLQAEETSLQMSLDELGKNYTELQEKIRSKENAIEKTHGGRKVLEERIAQNIRAIERIDGRNAAVSLQASELEAGMKKLAEDFDALEKRRSAAEFSVEQLQKNREATRTALDEIKAQSETARSTFFSDMQQLLNLRNELRSLEQEQEQRMRKRETLKRSIEEKEAVLASAEEKYRDILEEQSRNENESKRLASEAEANARILGTTEKELRTTMERQQDCQRRITAAETREHTLQKMQSAYDGFGFGIKAVLQAEHTWRSGIVGVIAELIQVENKYVTAIETALGEGAQNIVTTDSGTAKEAIAFLKKSNGGRATFLPLDNIQSRFPTQEEQRLKSMQGVCGFASELIDVDSNAVKAVNFLLGRVLIAEDMDAALAAAKAARFRLRVVTLSGDVVNAGGSMTGGSRKQKEGYLARKKEIDELGKALVLLHGEMLRWQECTEEQETSVAELRKKSQLNNEQLRELRLKADSLKMEEQQLQQEKNRENEALLLLLEDRSAITEAYMSSRDSVKALRASVQEHETKDTEAKELLDQLQRKIAGTSSELTAIENKLQDARVILEASSAKTNMLAERMKALDNDTLRLQDELRNNEAEQEKLRLAIADSEEEKKNLELRCEALMEELQEVVGGTQRNSDERNTISAKKALLETEIEVLRKKTDAAHTVLTKAELEIAKQESDIDHITEQLSEEYGLTEVTVNNESLEELEGYDIKALQKIESDLTVKIAQLGPINPGAIEEYHAVKERSDFLGKQYNDLLMAKGNLETVIGEINSGMNKRFKEAFAKINEYFADCYVKLFGGGTAVLKLSSPEDVLNSGIDIEVQPPGKKLQSLFLMSGGERSLTVIALLFALLSYQPSPFCILDEIDAALDDANIARFSGFLKDFSGSTQFIVITHRKGTMESADIMYGVTMEESGVSKLLSVRINERK